MPNLVPTPDGSQNPLAAELIFQPSETINARIIAAEHEISRLRGKRRGAAIMSMLLGAMLLTAAACFVVFFMWSTQQIESAKGDVTAAQDERDEAFEDRDAATAELETLQRSTERLRDYQSLDELERQIENEKSRLSEYYSIIVNPSRPTPPQRIQDALDKRTHPIAWKGDAVTKLEEDLGIIREAEDEVAQYMTVNNIPTRRRNPD